MTDDLLTVREVANKKNPDMDISAIPISCRGNYNRAMTGRSMRAAIKSHCQMCMGWQPSLVPGCTAPDCPLFPYRPGADRPRREPTAKQIEARKAGAARLVLARAAKCSTDDSAPGSIQN